MTNFDDLKLAVEAISGGKNTVIMDDLGMPSIVVPVPKLKYADVITGGSQYTLPAFIIDGVEVDVIYQSKYQNITVNNRAYSLPLKDPTVNINFDTALTICRNKGAGWHLQTNALWAAIALWCTKNNTIPHGNNNYGEDISASYEKGVPTYKETTGNFRPLRTATGSGPASWYHNYDISGIADLNGNVWEWCSGLRLMNGELQVIPYGNAMKFDCNMSTSSNEWKAILQDGTLVDLGTANTLKWDYVAGKITLATALTLQENIGRGHTFETVAVAAGVTVPNLLKALGLHPLDATHNGDYIYMNNSNESDKFPLRGGAWNYGLGAGMFTLALNDARSKAYSYVGFRSAFYGNL